MQAQDPLDIALAWSAEGRKVAIATVVQTWGSSPRQAGSRLIVDEQGNIEGSVSGGCVENSVVFEALECLDSGESRLLTFGVSDDLAWQAGLTCGGELKVYVEPLTE